MDERMVDSRQIERDSPTWRAVSQWAISQIEAARLNLEKAGVGPVETERERGRIAALRGLLALPEPRSVIPPQDAHY